MKETLRGFKMDEASNEPASVQEVFNWYEDNFGFVPNLAKVLSASPAALRSYWLTQLELQKQGILSPEEHNLNSNVHCCRKSLYILYCRT